MIENHQDQSDNVGYDPFFDVYHTTHDWGSSESVSHTVVNSIAELTGVEPHVGPPLSESIDPDCLNRLFRIDGSTGCINDHFTFTHRDCTVTVFRDGNVLVYAPSTDGQ